MPGTNCAKFKENKRLLLLKIKDIKLLNKYLLGD